MPNDHPQRNAIGFWKLALGIAFGLWLGVIAIGLTGALAWQHFIGSALLDSVPSQAPANDASQEMFDAYKRNLADIQKRDEEKSANAAKCQFWTQQNATAPSAKSRANVETFCEPRK